MMIAVANGGAIGVDDYRQDKRRCFEQMRASALSHLSSEKEGMVALPLTAKETESASRVIPKSAIVALIGPEMAWNGHFLNRDPLTRD